MPKRLRASDLEPPQPASNPEWKFFVEREAALIDALSSDSLPAKEITLLASTADASPAQIAWQARRDVHVLDHLVARKILVMVDGRYRVNLAPKKRRKRK